MRCRYSDILGDALQHRSGFENKSGQDDPTQVSSRSELRDNVGKNYKQVSGNGKRRGICSGIFFCCLSLCFGHSEGDSYVPFPWSGSTISSSPLTGSALGSSCERLPETWKKEPQSADMMVGSRNARSGKEVVKRQPVGGERKSQGGEEREKGGGEGDVEAASSSS